VVVPARHFGYELQGEVARPGIREFRLGDRVSDAVALAGGLQAWADSDSVEVWRFESPTQAERSVRPLRGALADAGGPADWPLVPGDRLYVRNVGDWHRRASVSVRGEVMRPGIYAIPPDGIGPRDLAARFGGFTSYADLSGCMILRPSARPTRDSLYVSLLQGVSRDLTHEELEYLRLHALAQGDLSERLRDSFAGRAGGEDFRLVDGDVIIVPTRTRSVAVYGAVRRPGVLPFAAGRSVDQYVELAGGYGDHADASQVSVTHLSNVQPQPARDLHEVSEGDIIWVPQGEPGNFLKSATAVVTVLAQLATIYFVIHQSTK
jgi:protein involved in polysaccharide export with SLBB domain